MRLLLPFQTENKETCTKSLFAELHLCSRQNADGKTATYTAPATLQSNDLI